MVHVLVLQRMGLGGLGALGARPRAQQAAAVNTAAPRQCCWLVRQAPHILSHSLEPDLSRRGPRQGLRGACCAHVRTRDALPCAAPSCAAGISSSPRALLVRCECDNCKARCAAGASSDAVVPLAVFASHAGLGLGDAEVAALQAQPGLLGPASEVLLKQIHVSRKLLPKRSYEFFGVIDAGVGWWAGDCERRTGEEKGVGRSGMGGEASGQAVGHRGVRMQAPWDRSKNNSTLNTKVCSVWWRVGQWHTSTRAKQAVSSHLPCVCVRCVEEGAAVLTCGRSVRHALP